MKPIIVALDMETAEEAGTMVQELGPAIGIYKVGMELYASAGMSFVSELIAGGKDVFLDLKFYDIPETVKRATAQVAKRGVRLLTVHGSEAVMVAAAEGRGESPLRLLAVTVLTSFDESDLRQMGYPCSVEDLVTLRTRNAMAAGMDGIVCSPLEVARVRLLAGPDAVLVTPGVRSAGTASGDQKRISTPKEAIGNGATFLVVGRQITLAANPRAEAERILAEIG